MKSPSVALPRSTLLTLLTSTLFLAIECKWDARSFDGATLQAFRTYYP
jgi:hypothetical protein